MLTLEFLLSHKHEDVMEEIRATVLQKIWIIRLDIR